MQVQANLIIMNFKNGLMVIMKESSDDPPLGVIIDVYHKGELINSYTYWYSDYE